MKRNLYKLEVACNNFFRKLLGLNLVTVLVICFVSNNIDNLYTRLRKSCGKFKESLLPGSFIFNKPSHFNH